MKKKNPVLDLTKVGYGILYQPRIGKLLSNENPFIKKFRPPRPSKKENKKNLV